MLLYQNDWLKYPTAIPDYQTSNKSFLHVARLYHEMGIKNCLFPLALINPELQGLDPFSKTLTLEQKNALAMECRWNFWYFLREVVRIPPQASIDPIQFIANRGNVGVFWLFFNNIDVALIQPRQTGKSTSVDMLMIWLLYVGADNSRISLFTLNDKLRKANIERLKKARDYLPKWLVQVSQDDADNKYEMSCKARGNSYIAMVGQNSEAASGNQGRGGTSPVNQFDEGPFTPFIGDAVPAALAAGVAVRREAERNGRPYGNIFTTTSGKKDDRDGSYIFGLVQDAAEWSEEFYDAADKNDLVSMIKNNGARSRDPKLESQMGKTAMVNITLSHRQLGYTDDWLAETLAITHSTGEKADRDFFNRWTAGSQTSPLSVKLNEIIRSSEREVLYTERSTDNYLFRWYIKKDEIAERMASGHFVFGLDTSDAGPGDGTALVLIDAKDLSVVGRGTYTDTNLFRLASYFVDMLVKYQNTTLIIEKKSSGQAIIDIMLTLLPKYGVDPFKRMFNRVIEEKDEREEEYREIRRGVNYRSDRFYDSFKTLFGFITDKNTRPLLTEVVLQESAKNAGHIVKDKALIDELLGLIVKNGRVDHPSGGHDDHVIAWLMACWLITYGKNLSEYGIPPGYALQFLSKDGVDVGEDVIEGRRQQTELMAMIEDLGKEIDRCRDEFIQSKLEHRLKNLVNRLSFEERQHFSVDSLLRSTSEERKKKQMVENRPYRPMDRSISIQPPLSRTHQGGFVRPSGLYY